MMKVVFYTHYTKLYGANNALLDELYYLKKKGIIPYVIVNGDGDIIQKLKEIEVEYVIVSLPNWFFFNYKTKSILGFIKKRFIILKFLFVFFINFVCNFFFILKIVKNYSPNLIFLNSSVDIYLLFIGKILNIPSLVHVREIPKYHYNLIPLIGWSLYYKILSISNKLIVVSNAVKQSIPNKLKNKCILLYDGVLTKNEFKQRSKLQGFNNKTKVTLGFIGILTKNKGLQLIIEALHYLKYNLNELNFYLIVAGEGDILFYKNLAKNYGVENHIKFIGYVIQPKYDFYPYIDCLINSSKFEAFGRTTVEAISHLIPVIGNKLGGGTTEIIEHNINGYIFEDNHYDLAYLIQYIINNNDKITKISYSAWINAYKNFNLEWYVYCLYTLICKEATR